MRVLMAVIVIRILINVCETGFLYLFTLFLLLVH